MREQVLAQLINQSLIVQAGKRKNIQADNAEIEAVIAANPSLKNPSASIRREIADSIIAEKVRQQAVMQHSRISDAEVARAIEQAKQQGIALPEGEPLRQYNAQHILIKADNENAAAGAESTIAKSTHKPAAAQTSPVWRANIRKTVARAAAVIWVGSPTA